MATAAYPSGAPLTLPNRDQARWRTSRAKLVSFCAVASSYTCSPKEAVGNACPVLSLKPGCFCAGMAPAEAGSTRPPDEAAARPAAPARLPSSRRVSVGGRVQLCVAQSARSADIPSRRCHEEREVAHQQNPATSLPEPAAKCGHRGRCRRMESNTGPQPSGIRLRGGGSAGGADLAKKLSSYKINRERGRRTAYPESTARRVTKASR